eukprot:SAG11_NODE_1912_length_4078_cov_2.769289_5_plen_314_part_00
MGQCMPKADGEDTHGVDTFSNPVLNAEASLDLIQACSRGDADAVSRALDAGASPDTIDEETSGTALMIAATHGNADALNVLIQGGAKIDTKHPHFGMTALLWACHSAHLRCVQLLIRAGADTKATDMSGLDGRELAKENMRLGWEQVVDLLTDDDMKSSKDFAAERAVSAARNKRMQRIMGEGADAGIGGMQYLQTSEQLNKMPKKELPTKPSQLRLMPSVDEVVESTDEVGQSPQSKSPGSLKRKQSRRMIIKGVHSEKEEQVSYRCFLTSSLTRYCLVPCSPHWLSWSPCAYSQTGNAKISRAVGRGQQGQ